jgi:hypothetical protein
MAINLKKYDPGIHCMLAYYMAYAGRREEDIAAEFGIPVGTFHTWRNRHPELRDAMKPGRDWVDNLVEGSLLKRALGFETEEITREHIPVGTKKNGDAKFKMVVTKRTTKLIPGDVGAQAFWLKNRRGWKDKYDVSHEVKKAFDFSKLPDEKLDEMERTLISAEVTIAGRN